MLYKNAKPINETMERLPEKYRTRLADDVVDMEGLYDLEAWLEDRALTKALNHLRNQYINNPTVIRDQ